MSPCVIFYAYAKITWRMDLTIKVRHRIGEKMDKSMFNDKSIIMLFLSIFLVGIGFSIIMPVLPYYAESMGANAFQLGLLMTVYALCQFLFAPFWGSYSDKVGRKPMVMIGLIGK